MWVPSGKTLLRAAPKRWQEGTCGALGAYIQYATGTMYRRTSLWGHLKGRHLFNADNDFSLIRTSPQTEQIRLLPWVSVLERFYGTIISAPAEHQSILVNSSAKVTESQLSFVISFSSFFFPLGSLDVRVRRALLISSRQCYPKSHIWSGSWQLFLCLVWLHMYVSRCIKLQATNWTSSDDCYTHAGISWCTDIYTL